MVFWACVDTYARRERERYRRPLASACSVCGVSTQDKYLELRNTTLGQCRRRGFLQRGYIAELQGRETRI